MDEDLKAMMGLAVIYFGIDTSSKSAAAETQGQPFVYIAFFSQAPRLIPVDKASRSRTWRVKCRSSVKASCRIYGTTKAA
jgi:hypothetical protein